MIHLTGISYEVENVFVIMSPPEFQDPLAPDSEYFGTHYTTPDFKLNSVSYNAIMLVGFSDARMMAPDVDKALQEIVQEQGKMDLAAAQEYLKRMRSRGRYSCDVWS